MVDDKVHCMMKAKEYEYDYWDGDRRYGYGGYKFIEGRWAPVAKALIEIYGLKNGSKVLDVGCGKAFLLYEMKKILPDLQVAGFDISKHGLSEARDNIKPYLFRYRAQDRYPFGDQHFDLVISLGTLHNLRLFELEVCGAGDRAGWKEQIHHGRGLSERARAVQPRMLGADCRIHPAYVGMDLALQPFRIHRRLRIHLFRVSVGRCKSRSQRRRFSPSRARR